MATEELTETEAQILAAWRRFQERISAGDVTRWTFRTLVLHEDGSGKIQVHDVLEPGVRRELVLGTIFEGGFIEEAERGEKVWRRDEPPAPPRRPGAEDTNPINALGERLKRAFPDVFFTVDQPADPEGVWYLDAERGGLLSVVVEWRGSEPSRFAICMPPGEFDEVFEGLEPTWTRVFAALGGV